MECAAGYPRFCLEAVVPHLVGFTLVCCAGSGNGGCGHPDPQPEPHTPKAKPAAHGRRAYGGDKPAKERDHRAAAQDYPAEGGAYCQERGCLKVAASPGGRRYQLYAVEGEAVARAYRIQE